ncbi:Hypothetical protein LCAKO_3065 [Lacticaseibacillus paracasei subsp. paracasei]|uniref:Uncharacterized protein n=1 Tax=Lacticaseibacillus paracasei subsp. paracasei TaxID=47714 RepID=A0AAP9HJT7_LACPA|nr:Hypothetical protein LCAKO_3065 [Lacticaseibacillus paracasei subsp. paracasei]
MVSLKKHAMNHVGMILIYENVRMVGNASLTYNESNSMGLVV